MDVVGSTAGKIIRFLVAHAHCAECGAHYRSEDVHVLAQTGLRIWDLAAVCPRCYTLSIVRAVIRPHRAPPAGGEAASPPVVAVPGAERGPWTELSAAEAHRFRDRPPIAADDVLDACEFLATFDGDFRGYFRREPDRA